MQLEYELEKVNVCCSSESFFLHSNKQSICIFTIYIARMIRDPSLVRYVIYCAYILVINFDFDQQMSFLLKSYSIDLSVLKVVTKERNA